MKARTTEQQKPTSWLTPLWTPQETSIYLGVPVATLYQWRYRSVGPKSYRVGKHIRYDPADVRQWLDDETRA